MNQIIPDGKFPKPILFLTEEFQDFNDLEDEYTLIRYYTDGVDYWETSDIVREYKVVKSFTTFNTRADSDSMKFTKKSKDRIYRKALLTVDMYRDNLNLLDSPFGVLTDLEQYLPRDLVNIVKEYIKIQIIDLEYYIRTKAKIEEH